MVPIPGAAVVVQAQATAPCSHPSEVATITKHHDPDAANAGTAKPANVAPPGPTPPTVRAVLRSSPANAAGQASTDPDPAAGPGSGRTSSRGPKRGGPQRASLRKALLEPAPDDDGTVSTPWLIYAPIPMLLPWPPVGRQDNGQSLRGTPSADVL